MCNLGQGGALKVYDCYRPMRAVKAIAAWAKAPDGDGIKAVFFPGPYLVAEQIMPPIAHAAPA
jgi:D-alanyl-D-alanine dipeptidase